MEVLRLARRVLLLLMALFCIVFGIIELFDNTKEAAMMILFGSVFILSLRVSELENKLKTCKIKERVRT